MDENYQQKQEDEMEQQYAEYLMEHTCGDRLICNGDDLTRAMEDGYLYDEFIRGEK